MRGLEGCWWSISKVAIISYYTPSRHLEASIKEVLEIVEGMGR